MASSQKTMEFQTEVKQILELVTHSLYSNKETFIRELVSNASDALDKFRFVTLSRPDLYQGDTELRIVIEYDDTLKTITIKDNGIGMDWQDAVDNLGTIARSGTKEFSKQVAEDKNAKDSNLIGQFGVGFYSSFIVADKVTVKSRKAGTPAEEGIVWESDGLGQFTIVHKPKEERGTEIVLHLKKDEEELCSDWRIRSIISKYSDHICWPILMKKQAEEEKTTTELETVNKATALWTLQKSEISEEDYKALYKHISHDFQDPLIWSHNHVEGKNNYISLLYIPNHAPFDLWQQESKHGLKLYVKRVFILDEATQFLPRYLRFIKGVVDASDLPLNVSREILQENKMVDSIKSACTKRVLSMLEKLSTQDKEKYQTFWDTFGLVMKEGPVEDFSNKDAICALLRFASTHNAHEKQDVSLADYVSRMQENQDKIYYITASSFNAAKNSPHLEIFRKKGIEVLLLSEKIDEWLVGYVNEFQGKKLQSISKGKVELAMDEEETSAQKEQEASLTPMLTQIKTILGEKIKDVILTSRLTDSPACVVADDQDMALEMQRILQAAGQQVPTSKPIFEINPQHALIKRLHDVQDDALFAEWIHVLFEQAVIAEGGQLENPAAFVKRINELLLRS